MPCRGGGKGGMHGTAWYARDMASIFLFFLACRDAVQGHVQSWSRVHLRDETVQSGGTMAGLARHACSRRGNMRQTSSWPAGLEITTMRPQASAMEGAPSAHANAAAHTQRKKPLWQGCWGAVGAALERSRDGMVTRCGAASASEKVGCGPI